MRDLIANPCWRAEDLGLPLPDSPHGVSVALPLWEHVVGYEEGDAAVTAMMRSGYPRFFLPERLQALTAEATVRFASADEGAWVFPSPLAAARCVAFVQKRGGAARVKEFGAGSLTVVVFPEASRRHVKEYWRFTGETVSTRWADAVLLGNETSVAAGEAAKMVIRSRLAEYAGVAPEDVFLFPSGMAAIFAAYRMVQAVLPGRRTAQLDFPYVDALKVQEEFGHGVHFYPVADAAAVSAVKAAAEMGELAAVFCEMPSNPLLRSVRLSEIAPTLRQHGVPLILDDTVATVLNIDALQFADVVTTSLTKSFSGAGDVLAGSLTLNPRSPFHGAFRAFLEREIVENDCFFGDDAVVLEENSRDFADRVRRSSANALTLAEFLMGRSEIKAVYYPALLLGGMQEILRPGGGHGCLLSVTLKDSSMAPAFYDQLRVCKGPSLGANFSLVCPYTLLAHYTELEWAEQCGVERNLLRISAGLESTDDLLERFGEAFDAIRR